MHGGDPSPPAAPPPTGSSTWSPGRFAGEARTGRARPPLRALCHRLRPSERAQHRSAERIAKSAGTPVGASVERRPHIGAAAA